MPVGLFNGNFRNGYYRTAQGELTSPRDDVLDALRGLMGETYNKFFNAVYRKYRHSDVARYERLLCYMLARCYRRQSCGDFFAFCQMLRNQQQLSDAEEARLNLYLRAASTDSISEIEFCLGAADKILSDGSVQQGDPRTPAERAADEWEQEYKEDTRALVLG